MVGLDTVTLSARYNRLTLYRRVVANNEISNETHNDGIFYAQSRDLSLLFVFVKYSSRAVSPGAAWLDEKGNLKARSTSRWILREKRLRANFNRAYLINSLTRNLTARKSGLAGLYPILSLILKRFGTCSRKEVRQI